VKENFGKKHHTEEVIAQLGHRLEGYKDALESSKKVLLDYRKKLEEFSRQFTENQLSNVQTALDITYLKEYEEKMSQDILYLKEHGEKVKQDISYLKERGEKDSQDILYLGGRAEKTSQDIVYLREQGDKTIDVLNEIKTDSLKEVLVNIDVITQELAEVNEKIEGLDKNVVNRLSEQILGFQKQNVYQMKQIETELTTNIEELTRKMKQGNITLFFFIGLNVMTLGALVVFILYFMGFLPVF
jgi:chromosome segregation ATPase